MGIGIAGLVADARSLSKYMRTECINHRFVYDAPMQVGRLVLQLADKAQIGTQRIGRRPYGVGLLVIGSDQTGPHLFEVQPSGMYFEYKGMAIGARSQAGRTYLERHFESFPEVRIPPRHNAATTSCPPRPRACSLTRVLAPLSPLQLTLDELIKHSLLALRETLGTGTDLTAANVAVGYVGLEGGFTILEDETIAPYVDAVKAETGERGPAADGMETEGGAAAEEPAAAMDTE